MKRCCRSARSSSASMRPRRTGAAIRASACCRPPEARLSEDSPMRRCSLPISLLVAALPLLMLAACKREAAAPAEPVATTTPTPPAQAVFTQGYVIELGPAQTQAELRAVVDEMFDDVVSIEP